jgi:serine/threonine protein kinase
MINAVEYCHDKNFIHRDLKPENILMDEDMNVKVADFGLSTTIAKNGMSTGSAAGTPLYMSPEGLFPEEYEEGLSNMYGPACDYWSLGIILYKLVIGKLPFDASTKAEMKDMVFNRKLEWPAFVTPELIQVITGLLNLDPAARYDIYICI